MRREQTLPLPGIEVEKTHPTFGWADLLVLFTVFVWGVNHIVVKAALQSMVPLAFNAMRFSLAALLIAGILLARGERLDLSLPALRRTLPVVLRAFVYQLLFIFGIYHTTAGNSSVILATTPIFVALYQGVWGRQKLSGSTWGGAVLTFAGVALLTLGSGKAFSAGLGSLLGDGLMLLAAVAWAGYTVGAQTLTQSTSPLALTGLYMLFTAVALDLMAIPSLLDLPWADVPWQAWAGVAFSALFAIGIATLFWNIGVQHLGSVRATAYSNLTPLVSLVAAWIVLSERLTYLQMAGAAIVLLGIWLARFGLPLRRDRAQPAGKEGEGGAQCGGGYSN